VSEDGKGPNRRRNRVAIPLNIQPIGTHVVLTWSDPLFTLQWH
jgi:hypothetical protein